MDFGAKLSQPGYDVNSAGAQDLIFSSSFPTLKEAATGIITGKNTTNEVTVYEHNLGYHPFFLVQVNSGSGSEMDVNNNFWVDDKKLYFGDTGTASFRWTVYRLPLYKDFQATALDQGTSVAGGVDNDFGLKFTKDGKDINSTDLRDFTLHSRGRPPLIHQVSTKDWVQGVTEHTVYHNLTYIPLAFAFNFGKHTVHGVSGFATIQVFGSPQAPPGISRGIDSIAISSDTLTSVKTSIVILKDPFVTTDRTVVNF